MFLSVTRNMPFPFLSISVRGRTRLVPHWVRCQVSIQNHCHSNYILSSGQALSNIVILDRYEADFVVEKDPVIGWSAERATNPLWMARLLPMPLMNERARFIFLGDHSTVFSTVGIFLGSQNNEFLDQDVWFAPCFPITIDI